VAVEGELAMKTLIRIGAVWVANIVALLLAEAYTDGLEIDPEWRVITAGAVFGVVNWAVKPVLRKLAAPLIILTLGIALFGVNLLAVYLASEISSGFELDDLNAAVSATFYLWLVNAIVQLGLVVAARRDHDDPESGGRSGRSTRSSGRR
jgi:putative membrane protein